VQVLVHDDAEELPSLLNYDDVLIRESYYQAVINHYNNVVTSERHHNPSPLTYEEKECLEAVQIVEYDTSKYQPTPIEQPDGFIVADELLRDPKAFKAKEGYRRKPLTYGRKTLQDEIDGTLLLP
jgi:hypothetical protein